MNSTVLTAVIAAAAGLVGGLLTASANRSVERLRARAALIEKAEERKLEVLEGFMLAVNSWLDWLMYMEALGWQGRLDEMNIRVRKRDETFRQVALLSSEDLFMWLTQTYQPLEYELKKGYVSDVRWGRVPSEDNIQTRREYSRLLRDDLVLKFRPEVFALRNPVEADQARRRKSPWHSGG
jgi:hypothetical protein